MSSARGIDRRIFVVGFPRSGTTLVQSLLASHGALTSFTESHFFWKHFTRAPWLPAPVLKGNPSHRVREFLAENGEAPPDAADWFAGKGRWTLRVWPLLPFQTRPVARRLLRVLDELTARRGRSGWVEKTPMHLYFVPFLERVSGAGQQTHFVHVIRDGLEAAASLHEASRTWERHYDLAECARRWNRDVSLSLRRVGSPVDHFVFYEELVSRPERALAALLARLGLPAEPGLPARLAHVTSPIVTAMEPWKVGVGGGIHADRHPAAALIAAERDRLTRLLQRDLYDDLAARTGRSSREWADAR
jgi:hypothetical protein